MIDYALVFLIVGLVMGALHLVGVAGIASQITWILFLIGIVLLVISGSWPHSSGRLTAPHPNAVKGNCHTT